MEIFMTTHTIHGVTLELRQDNIVRIEADAIVNAANAALAGGGGVDGALHRAGGPSIMNECRNIGGCPTGSAVATGAGNLKARYIFHAVGPIYRQRGDEAQLLGNAYQSCLKLAEQYQIQSIAFPSLSTGAYGYPLHLAAPIALHTVTRYLRQPESAHNLRQVIFVLLDIRTYQFYQRALQQLLQNDDQRHHNQP
jgi:O-acetyl-ADP-ribose deacetylase (regulator of RNase III)